MLSCNHTIKQYFFKIGIQWQLVIIHSEYFMCNLGEKKNCFTYFTLK